MENAMKMLEHPNRAVRGNNEMTLGYLAQVQKCIRELTQLGLSVINVEFCRIKPRVRVQACAATRQLEQTGRALAYSTGVDGQRYTEYQMMVQGIKVIWRTYVH